MKTSAEFALIAVAALCGLLSAAASYANRPRLAGIAGGIGLFACAMWLLLRQT